MTVLSGFSAACLAPPLQRHPDYFQVPHPRAPRSPRPPRGGWILLPSPLWGRGWRASGVIASRGGPGEGVSPIVNSYVGHHTRGTSEKGLLKNLGIGNKGLMVRETAKNLVSGRASRSIELLSFAWSLIDLRRMRDGHLANATYRGADDIDFNACQARFQKTELFCRGPGDVNHSSTRSGAAIINPQQSGFEILEVRDSDRRAQGKLSVSGSRFILVKRLTACSGFTLALDSVPACHPDFGLGHLMNHR